MQVADARRWLPRQLVRRSDRVPGPRLRALSACVVVVVLLAAVFGVGAWFATSTTWTSRAAAVLVPPPDVAAQGGSAPAQNPLLRLNSGLVQLAPVLAAAMTSPPAAAALRGQDADAAFSIDVGSPPLIGFDVRASSPSSAARTAAALLSVARDQLAALQSRADADGAKRATLLTVVPPSTPVRDGASRGSVTGVVAAAVLAVGLLAVLGFGLRGRGGDAPQPPRPSTRRLRRLRQRSAEDPEAVAVPRTR